MRIVFFGTPDFAVLSLRALTREGLDIVAVVTQPDKPARRSRSRVVPPPVKLAALDANLAVLQPERPSEPEFLAELERLGPDIGVVAAYGHILKRELLELPQRGMVNVHPSLLPKLRGASPIQHAILNGLTETGVSIMKMAEEMDAGPVILRMAASVAPDETSGELSARLAEFGARALIEALTLVASGAATYEDQDDSAATYAPKITRSMTRIDWNQPADDVARLLRAFDPKPGAWTALDGQELKCFGPVKVPNPQGPTRPGEAIKADQALVVATGDGAIEILDVHPAGKQRMPANAWLRGRAIPTGTAFE